LEFFGEEHMVDQGLGIPEAKRTEGGLARGRAGLIIRVVALKMGSEILQFVVVVFGEGKVVIVLGAEGTELKVDS
jgi:hypothetical protein